MTDKEKVIKWVEKQIKSNDYWNKDYIDWIPVSMFKDVLALVKVQEPRVLTLEEIQNNCPDYVYLEWLNHCICCIKDEGKSNKSVGYFAYGIEGSYYQFLWDTYGVKWRCWTAKPTDEQRKQKAMEWED